MQKQVHYIFIYRIAYCLYDQRMEKKNTYDFTIYFSYSNLYCIFYIM